MNKQTKTEKTTTKQSSRLDKNVFELFENGFSQIQPKIRETVQKALVVFIFNTHNFLCLP